MAIERRERKSQGRRKLYSYRVKWRYDGDGDQQGKTLDNEPDAIALENALREAGWRYYAEDPAVKYLHLIGAPIAGPAPEEVKDEYPTLHAACTRWANRPGLADGSKRNYNYVADDRLGDFGDMKLDQITLMDLENWLNTQTDEYSPATAFISRVVVAGALRMYGLEKVLIGLPRIDPARQVNPVFLEEEQVEALVETALATQGINMAAQVELTGKLGPRWGESCGLQMVHTQLVKEETAHIWIRQAVLNKTPGKDGFVPEKVKTRNAVRMLPLTPALTARMREATEGATTSRDLVFRPSEKHPTSFKHWAYDAHSYAWTRLKEATKGIPNDMRWHDLRHTAAKNMLERAVPIAYVSLLLGHSKVEVTVKEYGSFDQRSHDLVRRYMA